MRTMKIRVLLSLLLFTVALPVSARGPWRASEDNTRGWQLMSPEERIAHQSKVRGFARLDECRTYQLAHHQQMAERARQQGIALPRGGQDICAHLKPGTGESVR